MTKPGESSRVGDDELVNSIIPILKTLAKKDSKEIKDDKNLLEATNLLIKELGENYNLKKDEVISSIVNTLANKYDISRKEKTPLIKDISISGKDVSGLVTGEISIPVEIFSYKLSGLEALVKYLRENKEMSVSEIASQINRETATIWTTYNNSQKKQSAPFEFEEGESQKIPLSYFGDRRLSAFEVVVYFLKESGLKYSEIGKILNRDQRNVWSTYARVKKKLKAAKASSDEEKNSEKEVRDEQKND